MVYIAVEKIFIPCHVEYMENYYTMKMYS